MWMWVIVIGSAIWVLIDAKSIGVKKGVVPGMGNMGPWAWFFVVLFLWIIGFPMYLYYRGKFKQALPGAILATAPVSDYSSHNKLEQLEKLASLKERGILTEEEFLKKKQELL